MVIRLTHFHIILGWHFCKSGIGMIGIVEFYSILLFYSIYESDKSVFFKSLPNLKGIKKYDIRVENEYPKSLNNQLKKVKLLGYEMRQKGYITQIRYKQSELKLFRKKPGKKFVEFIE